MNMKPHSRPSRRGQWAVASWIFMAGLGLLGLWQFHNVEFYSNFDLVPGGRGDNRLVTALLEYFYKALQGTGHFLSPAFYYPAQGTLGYADVFLSYAVPYSFLRDIGLDIFTSYQVCGLLFTVLNYACAFLLLYKGLELSVAASSLGAFLFAFNAPKFNQISHPQLQCLFLLPLVVWLVAVWFKNSAWLSKRQAFELLAGAALLIHIQLLSAFYFTWFFLLWAALFLALSAGYKPTRDALINLWKQQWAPLLGGVLVFALGFIPFLYIYLPVVRDLGGKSYSEVQMMIPDGWAFLWMGPRHSWWAWLWDHCQAIRDYPVEVEMRMGLGVAVLAAWVFLALAAVRILQSNAKQGKGSPVFSFKTSNRIYYQFAAMAVLATTLFGLLGLRYPGGFSPWRLVYEIVPGGGSIRAVSRYILFLALPLSISITAAFQNLQGRIQGVKRKPARAALVALLFLWAVVAVLEQVSLPPYPGFSKSAELNRLEYLSEKLPAQCQAFYVAVDRNLPFDATNIQIDAMLISAVRGIPTLNGYSGANPKDWNLYKVRSPKYRVYLADWIYRNNINVPICELGIDK